MAVALLSLASVAAPHFATLWIGAIAVPAATLHAVPHARTDASGHATLLATARAGAVLLAVDLDKGTSTVIGNTGLPSPSLALAITPDGTAAYTIANTRDPAEAHLAKIDLATGAGTLVGSNPLAQDLYVMGMTFSPDGILYAAGDNNPASPTFNSLYSIDPTTGSATRLGSFNVGSTPSEYIMSFAVDAEGTMWGASMMSLYRIDSSSPAATKVVEFSGAATDPPKIMGIAIDRNREVYAADYIDLPSGGSTIYAVDLETGRLTPVVRTGTAFVHNIAFRPDHDELR
jgi:DNA-binding beta-propeller fold protein YncE